jgi:hypothetical protein
MANRRFIDFPIAASVGDNDIVLIWQDGLNKQTTKATLLQGSPQSLAGLTDVDIAGLTNGQILQYNSTLGKWENVDRTDINLSELGDVTIVAPTNGQVLVYNSSTSKWENSSGGYVPYTGAVTTVNLGAQTIQAGSFVKAGGTSAQFLKANGSVDSTAYGTGSVTSVGLTMPSAFNVANSPITTTGTLTVTGAGTVAQYIRGDGSLADFPESSGGGSSVSYYLNGSISQGTIGGVAYRELSKVPILGAGTDFTINADGYIASFITDAGDPNLLEIPGGNWNLETYFSASSGGGSPTFYVELYKVNSGGTATLIASNSGSPELIAFGTNLTAYFSSLAVPTTTLALTDRLAIRYYVAHSGRIITMHTENNHLCQIITTFTTGLTALNGLTAQVQNFATGTTGTDFNIASATATHTFNLPTASGTNRGALSSTDWTTFNNKENAITAGTTAQYFRGDKTFQTLNTSVVPEGTNLYYTEARVNANTNVAANTAARHNAVTLGTANGLSLSTQVLSLGLASAGVTGALSGTDWSTFNNKQNALTNPVTGTGTTNYLAKFTGSTTVGNSQVFDNGTNVGIATTPSAWAATALQINNVGLAARPASSSLMQLSVNQYWDGSNHRYISSNFATLYTQNVGGHNWSITSSGTAGNVITWTQAMTITNGGNLLVGTETDAGYKLFVNGYTKSNGFAFNAYSGGTEWQIGSDAVTGSGLYLYNTGGGYSMRLTPAGAATFLSSVTATSFSLGSGNGQLVTSAFWGTQITAGTGSFANFALLDSATNGIMYNRTGTLNMIFAGSVGIGTSSPNRLLTVSGTQGLIALNATSYRNTTIGSDSVGNFIVYDDTAAAYRMVINSSGNVAFNTTTPTTYSLSGSHIENFGGSNFAFIHNNTTTVKSFYATNESAGLSVLYTYSNHPLLFGTNNTERFRISSTGFVSAGAVTNGRLGVRGFTNDSSGYAFEAANASGNTLFIVRNDGVSTFTGNLGIGTYSPSAPLHIVTPTGVNFQNAIRFEKAGGYGEVNLENYYTSGSNYGFGVDVAGTTMMVVNNSGNVGIGTTSPTPHFGGNALIIQGPSGSRGIMEIWDNSGTGGKAVFQQVGGDTYMGNLAKGSGSGDLFLTANGSISTSFKANGNVLIGTATDNGNRLRVNGVGFFDQGVRTGQPVGTTTNNWLLGRALASGTSTPNRWIRVQIGLEYYDILAVYMGTL